MRSVWFGILGVALAAGLTWWLLRDEQAPTPSPTDPGDETVGPAEAAPVLKGSGEATPPTGVVSVGRFKITGSVVDEDDRPLAEVPIELSRSVEKWPSGDYYAVLETHAARVRSRVGALLEGRSAQEEAVAETVSDAAGRFTFRVDRAQAHTLRARPAPPAAGGYARAQLIEEVATTAEVKVRVYAGVPLRGRVVDAAGHPVQAHVRASYGRTWKELADSDAGTGAFAFATVPNENLSFRVTLGSGRQYSGFSATPPFTDPVLLTLPGGSGRVTGKVLSPENEGIDAALVHLRLTLPGREPKNRPYVELAATSDASGRFAIDGLPAGEVTYAAAFSDGFLAESMYAGRDGFAAVPLAAGGTAIVDLVLRRGSVIVGRVTRKHDEAPIEGATVTLYFRGWHPPQESACTTDADGRYRFEGIGDGSFTVLASHPRFFSPEIETALTQGVGGRDRTPPPHLSLVLPKTDTSVERDLVLAEGVRLSGVVVDPDGKPAADANVHVQRRGLMAVGQQWGMHFQDWDRSAVAAGADGTFAIDGLAPRPDWVLFARKVGYAGIYAEPVSLVDGPRDDVVVRLARQCVVRGRVLLENGEPLADHWVYVAGMSTLRGGDWKFKSDADGRFELTSLPANRLEVSTRLGQLSIRVVVDELVPGEVREGVLLQFHRQVEISGTVRTRAGEPVPKLTVKVTRQDGVREHRQAQTDERGGFRIQNVTPGRVRLSVSPDGRSSVPVTEVFEASTENVAITYEPPAVVVIEGTVLGPHAKPLPLGTVTGYAGDRRPTREHEIRDGRFRLEIRGDPPYSLAVTKPRLADGTPMNARPAYVPVPDPARPVSIGLEPGLGVSGRVVDAKGKGMVSVQVQAIGGASTKTDIEGAWRLQGLPPGPVGISVRPPAGYIPPESLVVEPGTDDVLITLERGVSVGGRVVLPESAKILGGRATVRWARHGKYAAGRANGTIQAGGSFTVMGIPPGTTVSVRAEVWQRPGQGLRVAPATVEGVKAGRTDVEIELHVGVSVSGTVANPDGTPFVDGGVSLRNDAGRGYGQMKEDGSFEVAGLLPGTYELHVFRGGQPTGAQREVTAPATGVHIVLPVRGTISGRLLDPPKGERWIVLAVDAETGAVAQAPEARVKADGTWTVGPLSEGRAWVVIARRDDGPSDRYGRSGGISVGADDVELTLQTGTSISGRVEREGRAVSRCWVRATAPGWSCYGSSTADGTFVVRGLPAGRYTLTAGNWTVGGKASEGEVPTGSTGIVLVLSGK